VLTDTDGASEYVPLDGTVVGIGETKAEGGVVVTRVVIERLTGVSVSVGSNVI
jgi:hypothetical protein